MGHVVLGGLFRLDLKCPHCGHVHTPATLRRLDSEMLQCQGCKRPFGSVPDEGVWTPRSAGMRGYARPLHHGQPKVNLASFNAPTGPTRFPSLSCLATNRKYNLRNSISFIRNTSLAGERAHAISLGVWADKRKMLPRNQGQQQLAASQEPGLQPHLHELRPQYVPVLGEESSRELQSLWLSQCN